VHAWLSSVGATENVRTDRATTALLRHRHESLLEESLVEVVLEHPTLDIQRRVVQGLAAKVLLHEALECRLLVVGNNSRRRVARYLLGSVSNATLRDAQRATVVVKASETITRSQLLRSPAPYTAA
ncbi:MAG: hypothetical protein JWP75_2898, partial [Frondihabitans sp.]|nr:hypothetical protein [Frondihabitans sp.]